MKLQNLFVLGASLLFAAMPVSQAQIPEPSPTPTPLPPFAVTVTVTKTGKSATFTVKNTGQYGGEFNLKRDTKFVFKGPTVDSPTKKRVDVSYLLNGNPMKNTTGKVTLEPGKTATVTIRLRILGTLPLFYTRKYVTTVTATQTKFATARLPRFAEVTDSATTTLVLKGIKD